MQKCEPHGVELEPVENEFLEVVGWACPIDCEFEDCRHHYVDPFQQMSVAEFDAYLDEVEASTFGYLGTETTHCWFFTKNGGKCPGEVKRTLETRDDYYGNFCPACGHSLRYHPQYGEGKPKDLAKRWRR